MQKEREYLSKVDLQRIEHPTEVCCFDLSKFCVHNFQEFFVSNVSAYYGLYGSLIEHAVVIFSNISPVFQDTPILLKVGCFFFVARKGIPCLSVFIVQEFSRQVCDG